MQAKTIERPLRMPSDGRLLLRFALGAMRIARERLVDELRACETATGEVPEIALGPATARHTLIGAAIAAPAAIAGRVRSARDSARRLLDPGVRALEATRAGRWLASYAQKLAARIEAEVAYWGALGQAEEAVGRALAQEAVDRIHHEVLAQLGGSAELQHLIEEHTAGLTRGVVGELRELSASADTWAERIVHRWRRRG